MATGLAGGTFGATRERVAPEGFDLYATLEARAILERCASAETVPPPIRRMLVDALHKFDEEIEAYFKPASGR